MPIGLFLDVDNTLTDGFIQSNYAERLGCRAEYQEIEDKFGQGTIDAKAFGRQLIDLFAGRGFTEQRADELYEFVGIQSWAPDLLSLPVDHYLVSSGPSYFINRFAIEHNIPPERVLCSQYNFNGSDGQISSCKSVGSQSKARFAASIAKRYALSMGIGDDAKQDGPFVQNCTIPVLVGQEVSTFLCIQSWDDLYPIIDGLAENPSLSRGGWVPGTKPNCFIGSSSESRMVARGLLSAGLARFTKPKLWEYSFGVAKTTIESLESDVLDYQFAIMIIEPDDAVISRDVEGWAPRDNVVFELGLFMGALGRDRVYLLTPNNPSLKIPSDLDGLTRLTYDATSESLRDSLTPAVDEIERAVTKIASRGR
jgi:predicted nucleotide-binding protein